MSILTDGQGKVFPKLSDSVSPPQGREPLWAKGRRLFSGKIYPDRTFSLGRIPRQKKGVAEKRYDSCHQEQFDSYTEVVQSYEGNTYCKHEFINRENESALRFIKAPKSSQNRGKYGSEGITAYGRKCVINIAYILQERFSRHRLGFGTATLPNLTREGLEKCLENFGEIVRRFFQEVKRVFDRGNNEFLYVGVVEIQPRRFAKTGLPYPHLHWVYVAKERRNNPWYISASLLRSLWRRVVLRVLGKDAFVGDTSQQGFGASIDCSTVKKSASSYLGKYMSKGTTTVEKMQEAGFENFPRQWWTASKEAKKMFHDSIEIIDSDTCASFFYQLECYLHEGSIVWAKYIDITLCYPHLNRHGRWEDFCESRCVGLVGKFSEEAYAALTNSTG